MRNTENGNAHIQALLAYYIPVHPAVSLRVSFFLHYHNNYNTNNYVLVSLHVCYYVFSIL